MEPLDSSLTVITQEPYTGMGTVSDALSTAPIMTIDQTVAAWLDEHKKSAKTLRAYTDGITSFRALLQERGYDLNSAKQVVALAAQSWLTKSAERQSVSASTYNQRRAILGSFYRYAIAHDVLRDNPLALTKPQKASEKDAALPLTPDDVQEALWAINRETLEGARDYALLLLAVTTGRRANELATLTWGNFTLMKKGMVVRFEHCKGDKLMIDELAPGTQKALLAYLQKLYGSRLASLAADAPIFVSLSRNNYGGQISIQTVANICKRYLGSSKVHTTRHTFAISMEKAGASLSDIGARLGHENLKTTSDYMKRLHSAENKYAMDLEKLFGV